MFKSIKFSFLIVTIVLSSCAKLPVETTFNGVPTSYLSTKSHYDFGDVLATIALIAVGIKLVEKYAAKEEACTPNRVIPVVGGGSAVIFGDC